MHDQLQLALIWNRVDVAKREIFTDDTDWKVSKRTKLLLLYIFLVMKPSVTQIVFSSVA